MAQSVILDRGLEDMWVYPQVEVSNKRGDTFFEPADEPVKIRVTTSVDQGSDAELPGQVSVPVLRCLARDAPLGAWVRIVYRGEEWDLAYPPRRTPGLSPATRHWEFGIRGRNSDAGKGVG